MYVADPSGDTSTVPLSGGYNIPVTGAPSSDVVTLPFPDRLFIPLESRRLLFSEIRVEEGQRVARGQVLAEDPAHYSIPLLAPCPGTVRLGECEGHIVLCELEPPEQVSETTSSNAGPSITPLIFVPQVRHFPLPVRFQTESSYQSRPISLSPQAWQ